MKRILSFSVLAIFFYSTSNAQLIYIRSQKEFNEDIFERTTKKQYAVADEYWLDENYDFAIKIYNNIKKDVEKLPF
jgi:hypothetical protein